MSTAQIIVSTVSAKGDSLAPVVVANDPRSALVFMIEQATSIRQHVDAKQAIIHCRRGGMDVMVHQRCVASVNVTLAKVV